MNALCRVSLAGIVAALGASAHAESLRCNGHTTEVGDSRLSLLYKCGEPLLKDSYCAPIYIASSLQPVPAPLVGLAVPCQRVDQWLYDRGPGNLLATVRLQGGVVRSIEYGMAPQ